MICHVTPLRLAKPEDVDIVRWVLEDPSVRVTFGTVTNLMKSFNSMPVFLFPGGVIALEPRKDWSVYAHVAALPESRGRIMNDAARELIAWLFANTPCINISGWIRKDNRAAQMWCCMIGLRKRTTRRDKILYRLTRGEYAEAM